MKKTLIFIVMFAFLFGCASTAVKQKDETYAGRAIFDVPITLKGNDVVNKVYSSINVRSDSLKKDVGFLPSPMPDAPGTPTMNIQGPASSVPTFFGTFVMPSTPLTTCPGAYAVMKGYDKGVSSTSGGSDSAVYTACIYPYKEAYRIYIIGNFSSHGRGGLWAAFEEELKKESVKAKGYNSIFGVWFDTIIAKFKEEIPNAKEIEISLP